MFRINVFSTMALAAALGLAAFSGPALARGGHFAGGGVLPYRVPGVGLGGYSLGGYGGVLPYRGAGIGLGGYSLGGYGGYGLSFYGSGYGLGAYNLTGGRYSYYGLPGSYGLGGYGLGLGGYGLGLRYGLGRGYLGIGVGNPGYYGGVGTSGYYGTGYPYSPLQSYGYDHPYGNGVYNYGGANPDFRQSGYGPPPNGQDAAREETDVAHLQVIMPAADAQLWVNDTRTRQQGTSRAFVSPTLKPGKKFAYDLRARWTGRSGQPIEETRSITVQAGDRQVVDFTQPPAQGRQPAPDRLDEQPPPRDRPAPQDQPPPVPPAPQDRPER